MRAPVRRFAVLASFLLLVSGSTALIARQVASGAEPQPGQASPFDVALPQDAAPILLVGPGSGGQLTQLLNGSTLATLGGGFPFGPDFPAAVEVAVGELTGDATSDYVVGMGPGGGLVTLYNGATITPIASGYPFGPGFGGGVSVATGDVNGDGRADIIVGQATGGGTVSVFSGTNIAVLMSQNPFGPGYSGGVNVASGDIDGDGRADVVVGQANGTLVSIISGATQAITLTGVPYGAGVSGVFVAAGDVNGDGRAEVVAAPASGNAPVIVFDVRTLTVLAGLTPFPAGPGGTRVAVADLSGDGRAEIVTVAGPGAPPELKVYSGANFALTGSRLVYDAGYRAGMYVAAIPLSALRFTSATSTTFAVGTAGTFTVSAVGAAGGPAITLTRTGALPAGVTFVDNGNGTATLAGTPSAGGTFPLVITATAGVNSVVQNFTLTVTQAPAFTSAATATFTLGLPGSFSVTTAGTPAATITRTGALPTGVTFTDNGNGTATIAGTPAAGTGGSYPITLNASNGIGSPATQAFTLVVAPPVSFTSGAATTFTAGSAGSFSVTTSGGLPPIAITRSGTLPAGVTFVDNGNGTATLSGTPGASSGGVYALTFSASGSGATPTTQNFTLTVNAAPLITSANTAAFAVNIANTFTITTSGHPAATVGLTGTLPTGLTFTNLGNGTGRIQGTAAAGTTGTYNLTVTATNGIGAPANQPLTLTVGAGANANDETFNGAIGNTQFSVGAGTPSTPAIVVAGTVLSNDTGTGALSAGPASIATTNGGLVAMSANGTFLYTPAVGFAGPSDTFTYVLTDASASTDTAVVTINLSGVVWYVNPAGGAGDGRSHSPTNSMTTASAAAQANQVIYVYAGSPAGVTTLKAGQALRGAGASFTFGGLTIPATTPPTLGTVTLANSVSVQGLSVNGGGSAAIVGSSLSGSETLTNVSITGGASGLTLTNIGGSLTMSGGAITGVTGGADILISGGTGTVAIGTPITNTGNRSIDISGLTGGSVTFSGAIADTGTGVSLVGNTGASIAFTGGLAVTTDTADAFTATGGGTVTATQNNTSVVNTLFTTSGQALRVINTTIGGAGLTFRSISAGNAGFTAGNGITLTNTGVGGGDGGVTVVGNGTAASGGIIRRKSGTDGVLTSGLAIYLENTKNASFSRMEMSDFQNGAIVGRGVAGFSLQNSTIDGTVGSAAGEGALIFGVPSSQNGLTGAGVLNNVQVSGASGHTAAFYNQSGSATLTIGGTTRPSCGLSSNSGTTGLDGLSLLTQGTAVLTVTIANCQFRGNRGAGIRALAEDNSNLTVNVSQADVHRIGGQGQEGLVLRNGDNAQLTSTITQSSFFALPGANVWMGQEPFNASATSLLRVTITNNEEFTQQPGATSPPWVVALSSTIGQAARSRILINNGPTNLVIASQTQALSISTPDAGTSPDADITLLNNHLDTVPNVFPNSVTIAATQPSSRLCTKIQDNTFHWDGAAGDPGNGGPQLTQSSGAQFLLERGTSVSSSPAVVIDENNPSTATPIGVTGTITLVNNGTCQAP